MPEVYVSGGGQPPQQQQATPPSSGPQVTPSPQPDPQVQAEAGSPDPAKPENSGVDETISQVLKRVGETKRQILWGAYTICPGKRFMDEMEDERIVMVVRAHPIMNVGWILMTAILLILPGVATSLGALSIVAAKYIFMGKLVWYLMTLGFAFEKFLDWYYSFLIVTNERLVDVDFINLLTRDIQYANLNHIEEPSLVSGGFIRSIFNYGDVSVATAAEEPAIEALAVPFPEKIINIISELSEELEKSQLRRTVI